MKVSLLRSEREYAACIAIRRCLSLILTTPNEDSRNLWWEAIRDCTAEKVVANALGLFWIGEEFFAQKIPRGFALDVSMHPSGIEVFSVYKPSPTEVFVFVEEGETPLDFVVVGWVTGADAGRREYRARGGNFLIPRAALNDIESLLAFLEADPLLAPG